MNLLKLINIFSDFSNNSKRQMPEGESAQDTLVVWDDEADIVVLGFGGAGACAAIEATDVGSDVMIVERFSGGGATNASGGVVYTGGGTRYQKEAGFDDTPENMFNYLKHEVKGVVKDSTLKTFCEQSADNLAWLEKHGLYVDRHVITDETPDLFESPPGLSPNPAPDQLQFPLRAPECHSKGFSLVRGPDP